jgi:hypothetical protein
VRLNGPACCQIRLLVKVAWGNISVGGWLSAMRRIVRSTACLFGESYFRLQAVFGRNWNLAQGVRRLLHMTRCADQTSVQATHGLAQCIVRTFTVVQRFLRSPSTVWGCDTPIYLPCFCSTGLRPAGVASTATSRLLQ